MTSKNEPLRGKVARILNSRELVINIGEQEGVEIGMLFDVLDPKNVWPVERWGMSRLSGGTDS